MNINWNSAAYINWTTDTGIELKIENAWDWLVFCDIFVNRCYPLQLTVHDPTYTVKIVDLGANVGYFSLYAAHIMRKYNQPYKIYAFEAMSDTFKKLWERTDVYQENIQIYNYAVGKKSGTTNITISANHGTSFVVDNSTDYPHEEVPYVDLNEILSSDNIDILKCDIEGSEYDFVYNYSEILKRTQVVFMEIHYNRPEDTSVSRNGEENVLREKMKEYGFTHQQILVNHETASVEVFARC